MPRSRSWLWGRGRTPFARVALAAAALSSRGVVADNVLTTTGFSNCNQTSPITVNRADITYNNSNMTVTFDVRGTSSRVQNVTAELTLTAYGQEIYQDVFDPCEAETSIEQLCPLPVGTFSARGTQQIPEQFASLVPDIAFQIPDIASLAQLKLWVAGEDGEEAAEVACVQAEVSNGATAAIPGVQFAAAGIAGAALVMTGVASAGAAVAGGGLSLAGAGGGLAGGGGGVGGGSSGGGAGTISPSFAEVMGWMQGMAMNGMLSVNYPSVYRQFTKNFAFSAGIVPWAQLQTGIDSFRGATGGNLTADSFAALRNTTLVFPDGSTSTPQRSELVKRALESFAVLTSRQINPEDMQATEDIRKAVSGIAAYVEELSVPRTNSFMTVLLLVAIAIASIVVGILLVKVVLELWALFGSFPRALSGFRQHYWRSIGRAVTSLILVLYGVWVLYCVFQFTNGDSWAARGLAAATLAIFTAVLGFFSWKIWSVARQLKRSEGDASALYDEKDFWVRYSVFYQSYSKGYWWIFVPTIVYMFVKGATLAATDGNGMVQTASQLFVEAAFLMLLLWSRPYERRSGNIINISIQVVRVLSICCVFVFVEELNVAQTTATVTGAALIVVQSVLTGILALLIVWNAFNGVCGKNPHRMRRKEMEAAAAAAAEKRRSAGSDLLTPLGPEKAGDDDHDIESSFRTKDAKPSLSRMSGLGGLVAPKRSVTPQSESLILSAAPLGRSDRREPTVPNVQPYNPKSDTGFDGYFAGGGGGVAGDNYRPEGYPATPMSYSQPGPYGQSGGQSATYGNAGYRSY